MTAPDSPAIDQAETRMAALAEADDRTLVLAFQAGDRAAFDVIVVRHRRPVYQVCYRFVNNHEDASDLAQDVFVRAFKGLVRFKGDASLATWLYRVAVNTCLNRVAVKKPATAPLEAAVHVDGKAVSPLDELLRHERADKVRAAIEQLPPKQKATLLLRVYQESSHEEIATALGSSVGAVKANFFHALKNLRRALEQS
ncbi:MAG TPA: sigma-70 family RNA polymerase sigma factor [Vicinamibacterales bacterium]|nr:sigma-70 family RNA polymerase sigma factor [Vicinamibacterales bacterium]